MQRESCRSLDKQRNPEGRSDRVVQVGLKNDSLSMMIGFQKVVFTGIFLLSNPLKWVRMLQVMCFRANLEMSLRGSKHGDRDSKMV